MSAVMHKTPKSVEGFPDFFGKKVDVYFSADVETDGSIPGHFSMLSFALVYAGAFDGETFFRPPHYQASFYRELRPITDNFDPEALAINGLNRDALLQRGGDPHIVMTEAAQWVRHVSGGGDPIFVAYPLSFDWSWIYWYFVAFSEIGSPFGYSRCFDIKTAIAVKLGRTIASVGRERIPNALKSNLAHTHHALDDAKEQAQIFANVITLD